MGSKKKERVEAAGDIFILSVWADGEKGNGGENFWRET